MCFTVLHAMPESMKRRVLRYNKAWSIVCYATQSIEVSIEIVLLLRQGFHNRNGGQQLIRTWRVLYDAAPYVAMSCQGMECHMLR
jgi:hypothetical protein